MAALIEKPKPGYIPASEEATWGLRTSRAPKLRPRLQWAEEELVLAKGPYRGRRFKCERQPFTRLLLDEMDSGRWRQIIVTGCIQSGKTVCASLIPVLWHLFEVGETVGFALPDMQMASDKWDEDLRPEIERSRYAHLIPAVGEGSRGGTVKNRVLFRNGAALKFFGRGGSANESVALPGPYSALH